MTYQLDDVTGYESPEDVVEIHHTLEDNRAHVDIELIQNSLSTLQAAVALIEAQVVLQKKVDAALAKEIAVCVTSDEHAFHGLFHEATTPASKNHKATEISVDPASISKTLSDVTDDYVRISHGNLSGKLENMDAPQLTEKIFDLRCHFAELSVEKAQLQLAGVHTDANYIKYMKRFVDEGIVEDKGQIETNIRDAFRNSADILPHTYTGLETIKRFMGGVYEMGDDNYGTAEFKVERYHPVSIRTIRFF
ncbi:MAG: hypothetical protein DI626_03720 [Micavibrio aeruginosavorus]|uniref:Uncharacterized protein n=1 Tax=Micavibrio aeruginosavorus TaxID=349221 RepID=A0A2W5A1W7_9BACT|nr:MAG: hypothetical protein DI626_03720 [Micavibrio aeruginosavorus]